MVEDYRNTTGYFETHIYLFQYGGEIRNAILNYKFNEKPYIYRTFVNFLKNSEKMYVQIKKYDIIIPVPISKKRLKQRGYNQSAIISKNIAKNFNLEHNDRILTKIRDNKMQSSLDKEDREKNVRDVYSVTKTEKIKGKKILLIDDIFTTGNTVNECSRVLKNAGATEVGIFTIAKD